MPIIISPPPEVAPITFPFQEEWYDSPNALSKDGINLERQFRMVQFQWNDRTPDPGPAFETDVTLQHVPFQNAGTIKVRFQKSTPMKPRKIDIQGIE